MATGFLECVDSLAKIANRFDKESNRERLRLILMISKIELNPDGALSRYVNVLLHSLVFPADKATWQEGMRELSRIANFLRELPPGRKAKLKNTGLPFTEFVSCFSYDCVTWIRQQKGLKTSLDRVEGSDTDVNEILGVVFPSLLRSDTTAGYTVNELFDALEVARERRLDFLLNAFKMCGESPFVRDLLFGKLSVYLRIAPTDKKWSFALNRLSSAKLFFHDDLLRKFDSRRLIEKPVQPPVALRGNARADLIRVIKATMALTDRETDTVTYMDERSVRCYRLDRGIAVAIYGMIPVRQMPLESYVGYTLFKNGWPVAYGGGWVFGRRCGFGINIFEPYRGGESGYLFCQLLRVYAQVFGVRFFEVESFQFGEDNAEGIESGAFWFYYRYGFRPTEQALKRLAEREFKMDRSRPTSGKTLKRLATGNLTLNLGGSVPMSVYDVTHRIKLMIRREYQNDVESATEDCAKRLIKLTGSGIPLRKVEKPVLGEFALWTRAFGIRAKQKARLLIQLAKAKPVDVYQYQRHLLKFLND